MIENVPDGWKIDKLGNLCDIATGKKDANHGEESGEYLFFTCAAKPIKSHTYSFDGKSIILAGNGANVGLVLYYDGQFEAYQRTYILNNFNENSRYIYYNLKKNWIIHNESRQYGSATNYIKMDNITEYPILIPPLPQQEKIVKVLDISSALIEKQKELIQKYDLFLKSKFIEMFGDPISNPMGWEVVSCIDVADCIVPGRDKPKSFTGDTPWITTNDLKNKGIINGSKSNIGLSNSEITNVRAKIIPKESVIFTCVGDLGIVSITNEDIIMNQQLHSFQCKKSINNVFLMFNISQQKPYMYKMATSTTVPYMNKTTCNNIPTILPPIELQNKFASIVEKTEKIKEQEAKKLQHLETLHKSLMDKAFKGEIQ